jgi:hypothetical protein
MICLKHNWIHDPRIPCPYCERDRLKAENEKLVNLSFDERMRAESAEARVQELEEERLKYLHKFRDVKIERTHYRKVLEDNLHYLHGLNDAVGLNFQYHDEIMQMIHRATKALEGVKDADKD